MVNPRANEDIKEEYALNLLYWKQQLQGAHDLQILPTVYPKSLENSVKQECLHFSLCRQITNNLLAFCNQHRTSLSSVLLCAYKILLYRYTSQTNIVIGVHLQQEEVRHRQQCSRLGEILILPFRTDLSDDPDVSQFLKRVSETLDAFYKHRHIRREDFLAISSCNHQFHGFNKTVFSFKNTVSEKPAETSLPEDIELLLSIEWSASGLSALFKFNTQLYDEDFVFGMSEHFTLLLNGIIKNPTEKIGSIPILTEAELSKLTAEWNDTYSDYPHTKCLHQLFEEQVLRSPGAIAVQLHAKVRTSFIAKVTRELTFQELDSYANQLANYLKQHRVGPEVIVGIFMKRSMEMMIAIMGILKAGGAYFPIDPSQPKDRLDFMLQDSGISILLTQYQLLNKLPHHEIEVVCLDAEWKTVATQSELAPTTMVAPENLAYLIYTSGSTGMPKGTLVIHKGVVNYLSWCTKAYAVNNGIGAPVNTSLGFDATVTSLLSPLMVGKRVFLLPEEDEIEILGEVLSSPQQFSIVKITPAHLAVLDSLISYTGLQNNCNAVVIGGEALNSEAIKLLRKQAPAVRIFNEYGPTETVVGCAMYEVGSGHTAPGNLPIGRPISNTRMYILDERLQHVPIGTAGELFIGGDGVARGYLNRAELTSERFIPDPFSATPGAKLYKTGDIARYLKDGNILFLGRRDNQVKIRGYRIEISEIMFVLRQYPGVQDAIVIVEEIPGNGKRLLAYLVFNDQTRFNKSDIRSYLASRLPEYMIPSEYINLEVMPLTLNGKVDKAVLPLPDHTRPELTKSYKSPATRLEKELVVLFEKVLLINRVGVKDNLFELGVHSLQVYWVFAQIKTTTGIQLPLSILFQYPTVEKLAGYLEKKDCKELWCSLVPIQPQGSQLPLFCIHGGGGTVLFYQALAQNLGEDQPVYGLQPLGLDGKENFHSSIEQMASHYIKEIQTVNTTGPYLLAGYCFGAVVAFEMAQQLQSEGFIVSLLLSLNGVSPTYVEAHALNNHQIGTDSKEIKISKWKHSFLRFNWQHLKGQSSRKKVNYFLTEPAHKLLKMVQHKVFGKIKRGYTMGVYLSCQKFGLKCPASLRKFYFLSTNTKMVKDYKPKKYAGNFTIIRSPGLYPDPHIGWTDFVVGEIRTVDIPGKHKDRRQVLNEPFVKLTAAAIKSEIIKCSENAEGLR
jgi:amino acid adenylation domain-containing protein